MSVHHGPLVPGSTFGPFKIVGPLGKGGMGAVYKAHDPGLGRDVALKVLFREFANDPMFLERFAKEQASAAINHPHVVRVHGGGIERGIPYLVMELLPGGTLSERLKREGRLPWQRVAKLGSQIASALGAVHAAGLVHRDLKPANVLLDEEGNAKLSDFGVVRTESSHLTKTGELLGTPQYMAPEQVESGKHVDWRADLYSLGATLYALLVGHPPFDGPGYVVIGKKLAEVPTSTSSEVEDVPRVLDKLIAQLLARHPQERPESAAAVARKLDAIARGKLHGDGDRGMLLVGLVGLVAVVISALAVALWLRRNPTAAVPPPLPPQPPTVVDALELVIDEPADGALVPGESVKVRGHVRGGASVEVAKKTVSLGANGSFEATVPVEGIETVIPLVALAGSKKAEKTRTVYRPPEWFFDIPKNERPPLPLPRGLAFGSNRLEYVNRKDESVLVWAPPARFTMGGADADVGAPIAKKQVAHVVELSGFFVGKYEVSVAQFERYVKETRAKTAIEDRKTFGLNFWVFDGQLGLSPEQDRKIFWRNPQRPEKGQEADPSWPVSQVTADDVDAYCKWAGLRLPTEAQWERAASFDHRTQTKRRFPWGDEPPTAPGFLQAADAGWMNGVGAKSKETAFPDGTRGDSPCTVAVTSNEKGASPIGALNMAGNVAEWCRDELDADFYTDCSNKGVVKDPCLPPAGHRRVHRGGHFASLPAECYTARRFYLGRLMAAWYRYPCDVIGFRICRELGD